jgi:predicted lipoprotein with Yx(FWY)xxD motif
LDGGPAKSAASSGVTDDARTKNEYYHWSRTACAATGCKGDQIVQKFIATGIAGIVLVIAMAVAFAQTAPATIADTSKGKVFVNSKGMTLYMFDRDTTTKSNCNGQCATVWPPFIAAADVKAADWTIVVRDDGSKQWAYKGRPLYSYSKDTKPGDVIGDGLNNVWHVAVP